MLDHPYRGGVAPAPRRNERDELRIEIERMAHRRRWLIGLALVGALLAWMGARQLGEVMAASCGVTGIAAVCHELSLRFGRRD